MGHSHLEERLVAVEVRRDRHVLKCPAGRRSDDRGSVGVLMRVDPDDEIDLVCKHCHAFIPLPEGRGRFPSPVRSSV
jgi:hypothetical protein